MQIRNPRLERVHSTKPVSIAEHIDEKGPTKKRQRPTIRAAADKAATRQPPNYFQAHCGFDGSGDCRHQVHKYHSGDHHHDNIDTTWRGVEQTSQRGEASTLVLHAWRDSSCDVEALKVSLRQTNLQDIFSMCR